MMRFEKFYKRYSVVFVLAFLTGLYIVSALSYSGGWNGFQGDLWGQSRLISTYADIRLKLGDRVFPSVLVGKDGWYFYTAERTMDDYQNTFQINEEQLKNIRVGLEKLNQRLTNKNKILILVIVPNKQTIYADKVPELIQPLSDSSRLEQLTALLEENGPPILIDLRPVLTSGRLERDVFYKTDTHWNDYGIYLSYQAIIQRLSQQLETIPVYGDSEFEFKEDQPRRFDLVQNIGAVSPVETPYYFSFINKTPAHFRQIALAGGRQILMSWVPNNELPSLVMYHDSYGFRLRDLLAMHFRNAVFVPHYTGQNIANLDWINQTNPDVVIFEFAERYLHDLDDYLRQR